MTANIFNNVSYLAASKKNYENTLSTCLSDYTCKYIRRVNQLVDEKPKDLQKALVDVASWRSEKRNKEYKKFLKWAAKNINVEEEEIQDILNKIIILSLRIMLYKYDSDVVLDNTMPLLEDVVYKCMKRVCRFFYENLDLVKKSKTEQVKEQTKKLVISSIHSFIPLEQVLQLIEDEEERIGADKSYDFEKDYLDSTDRVHTKKTVKNSPAKSGGKTGLVVQKEPSDARNELHYVSSDEVYNEYYNSEEEKEHQEAKQKVDEDVKYIKIPKIKKGKR